MSDDRKLPVTPDQAYAGGADPSGESGASFEGDAGPRPAADEVPSWRLVSTLAVAGALAGSLIVGVFQWAQPQILEYKAGVMTGAIEKVLGGPERVQTLYVTDDGLDPTPPAGADTVSATKVHLGFDAAGQPVGFAIMGAEPGFQDVIQLMFGYDPVGERVLGMEILDSKETPGLGDKIFKDASFVSEFVGVKAPLIGVKEGAGAGDEAEVDLITGATISSRTVIGIINHRVEALGSMLKDYLASGGMTAGASVSAGEGPVSP